MAKLMDTDEAEEIINTMLDDYGLDPHIVVVETSFGYETRDVPYYAEKKFLWWTRKEKVIPTKSWVSATTLAELVIEAEEELKEYDEEVEITEKIRERHAMRLLNKKLEE